jgi:HSP20 family protein
MALVRWTPMGDLQSFQHEMNRMFDEFFRGGNGETSGTGLSSWTPAVDIHETDDGFVIKAELPGVSKDDISIDVHQNTLTLRGQRKHEAERSWFRRGSSRLPRIPTEPRSRPRGR